MTNSPLGNRSADEVLDQEFLIVRAKLLEVAASLDRIERAAGSVADDPRLAQIERALAAISEGGSDRAAQLQRIFSLSYEPNWRDVFGLADPN